MAYIDFMDSAHRTKPRTFTANEMHQRPADVFREVDRWGVAHINHDRYPDKMFVLTARPRKPWLMEVVDEQPRTP